MVRCRSRLSSPTTKHWQLGNCLLLFEGNPVDHRRFDKGLPCTTCAIAFEPLATSSWCESSKISWLRFLATILPSIVSDYRKNTGIFNEWNARHAGGQRFKSSIAHYKTNSHNDLRRMC